MEQVNTLKRAREEEFSMFEKNVNGNVRKKIKRMFKEKREKLKQAETSCELGQQEGERLAYSRMEDQREEYEYRATRQLMEVERMKKVLDAIL